MPSNKLEVYLLQFEKGSVKLSGELTPSDADLLIQDELISVKHPVSYDLNAERLGDSLLITGSLRLIASCECARCLKPFELPLSFDSWACYIPLEGEDQAEVLGDCVDLTPYIREDIVLSLPQQPLCESGCSGLPGVVKIDEKQQSAGPAEAAKPKSVWDQLDQLKLS
jgi:uncharacterized metal-binding protein YceD (DUF177 family)